NNGQSAVLKYLTGYVVEKSLSVDNIFVIAMVFSFFSVPPVYQHRVLFWGVIGALVLRAIMIVGGSILIAEFHWILYVFAAFLIFTAAKMLFMKSDHSDLTGNPILRAARRMFPLTSRYHGEHFLVRAGSSASHEAATPGSPLLPDEAVEKAIPGTLMLTPLALALVMVETTDVIFAVDSIPAIFAVTGDPFLVFTSNVFALLGLRSLYFALAGMIQRFRYLTPALALVLFVVGAKMLTTSYLKEILGASFNLYLLGTIFLILAVGVGASLLIPPPDESR
ncbi:MAG: TerC/Alx family metal homeostasis membrane protein, partial [Ignavibacteriales bacterium]|nr:TerC/Alx family metal homeostasis membrane protein [Ignavibacteriales bacterium]